MWELFCLPLSFYICFYNYFMCSHRCSLIASLKPWAPFLVSYEDIIVEWSKNIEQKKLKYYIYISLKKSLRIIQPVSPTQQSCMPSNKPAASRKPAQCFILVMEMLSRSRKAKLSSTDVCVIVIQCSKHRQYGVAIHGLSHESVGLMGDIEKQTNLSKSN